jgi:hypothetical protein
MTDFERPTSSLDDDAGAGSQGEVDPGSEGDFTGEPTSGSAPMTPGEETAETDEESEPPT